MTFTDLRSVSLLEPTDRTVLVRTAQDDLIAVDIRRRDVLFASLRSSSLDRRLANGEEPERDRLLAVRAALTTSAGARESLAHHFDELLNRARGPLSVPELRVPIARDRIVDVADDIERLTALLRSRRPVRAASVAAATQLLTDGASPIYVGSGRTDVRSELRSVIGALTAL